MLLVKSGTNEYVLQFDPTNNVAHQTWLAFADGTEGSVLDGDPWVAVYHDTTRTDYNWNGVDSFAHGEGAFILDDDHCWCEALFMATNGGGKSYCGWSPGGAGVGTAFSNGCHSGGPLELYFSSGSMATPSPTSAPPSSPSPSAPPQVSAFGDPHLTNVYGERFDLMRQGKVLLINIPRGKPVEYALLAAQADVRRMGVQCADMYFQRLNITGAWADEVHAGGLTFDAETTHEAGAGWAKFGPLKLKVVHGRTEAGIPYLNFYAKHLGKAGFAVGGLLGEDDHTEVSTPEAECGKKELSLSRVGKTRLAPSSAPSSIAVASLD
ncbi:unnamed protein product [Prorocentrum cordatum]|uniref:DOMON domain-containing protein n=1 Tax=Prorocentrum cordatum TaxID=2364126 RepID=A0ABN9URC7_9DINO|nr:unnamed protein product [Polarella glacialis]